MDTINGRIEKISKSEGIARTGKPFTRWVFEINNKTYSTFDETIGNKFKVGDNVEMTGEQEGQYWNMKTMTMFEVPVEKPGEDWSVGQHQIIISRSEKPHSYEFGKAGMRHKIYYGSVGELKQMMEELKEAKLLLEEEITEGL